jgi:hypothetical protein
LIALCASPIQAAELELSIGSGLVCNTAQEVEAVVMPRDSDVQRRVMRVNDLYGKDACNIVTVIFFRGDEAKTMLVPEGVVHVVEVQIVGVRSEGVWVHISMPMDQYAAILDNATNA